MNFIYRRVLIAAFFLLTVCASFAAASTPQPPAVPRDYIVDLAGVIPEEVQTRLNSYLRELEQKTTAQVLVLTVNSLDGQNIEEFAFTTKEQWKLGQKGKDNGVLIVVAVQDRKYRFEVGYGLEGMLPDSLVGSIGREYLVPYFRKGDYGAGVYAATLVVANTIAGHEGVEISGMPGVRQPRPVGEGKPPGMFQIVVLGILALGAIILFITHPRECMLLMLALSIGRGRSGWSGGGGGGGGFGGGGSFGGGGGGSGGGGGASGGW